MSMWTNLLIAIHAVYTRWNDRRTPMSIWAIAWGYLWDRKITTFLTIFSVALGVAMISAVLTLRYETERRFEEEGRAFDVVVGAKGSPLQLVLSALYFMDQPTGNILWSDYEKLKTLEDVYQAFPIGLGDTFHGGGQSFRIVGATPELMDYVWENPVSGLKRFPFKLAEGRYFENKQEVVLGSFAARMTGKKIGDTFVGAHGMVPGMGEHEEHPFEVVGILEASGTPFDRTAICSLETVWEMHAEHDHAEEPAPATVPAGPTPPAADAHAEDDHNHAEHGDEAHADEHGHEEHAHDHADEEPKEVTAVLVRLNSPATQFQVRDQINKDFNAMAALPVMVIMQFYYQFLGVAKMVLLAVAYIVVVISAISIMIGLYLSIFQRRRDLAVMRALGASPSELFGTVLVESLLITVLGITAGFLLGGGVAYGLGQYLEFYYGLNIRSFLLTGEHLTSYGTVAFVGLIAGVFPARQAYYTEVATNLAEL